MFRETGRGGGLTVASGPGGRRRGVAGSGTASRRSGTAGDLAGLDGRRGGNDGLGGGGSSTCRPPLAGFASLLPVTEPPFTFFASGSRLGGRGGRLAGSYAGGNLRPPVDTTLVLEEDTARPADRFDADELYETSDDDEFRRGSVGAWGCRVERRGGSSGAAGFGAAGSARVRAGGLGGTEGVVEALGTGCGSVWAGDRAGLGGRPGFDAGRGGGGGRLAFCSSEEKFFWVFKAAIRWATVVYCGSSMSAMAAKSGLAPRVSRVAGPRDLVTRPKAI